jgi:hypothetical protein
VVLMLARLFLGFLHSIWQSLMTLCILLETFGKQMTRGNIVLLQLSLTRIPLGLLIIQFSAIGPSLRFNFLISLWIQTATSTSRLLGFHRHPALRARFCLSWTAGLTWFSRNQSIIGFTPTHRDAPTPYKDSHLHWIWMFLDTQVFIVGGIGLRLWQ